MRTSALTQQFLEEASYSMRYRFIYSCIDRAVRSYAVHALRKARRFKEATQLSSLPMIRDFGTSAVAENAMQAVSLSLGGDDLPDAVFRAVRDAADAAVGDDLSPTNAARAAYWAYRGEADERAGVEQQAQEDWIRRIWLKEPFPANILADLDAYIADGLLLGDDE